MTPVYETGGLPVAVAQEFTSILSTEIEKAKLSDYVTDVILNFRYPSYSAEKGGFRPVEVRSIRRRDQWHLDYVTEFTYLGIGPYAELAKDLDFNFGSQSFTSLMGDIPQRELNGLFQLWCRNFISYYHDGVYEVSVSTS
jgi:hypothetical protein